MPSGGSELATRVPAGIGAPAAPETARRGLREVLLEASGTPAAPFVGIWGPVTSTNDVAKAVAHDAGKARCGGSVVIAESQSDGKGRFGRSWASPPGGLYLSFLVEPGGTSTRQPPDWLPLLPLAAGVAVARAVRRSAGVAAELRWPNDLDWKARKVAGVLAEIGFRRDRPQLAVVGFGVNLGPVSLPGEGTLGTAALHSPGSLPAGVDRVELAGALVASFRETLGVLRDDRTALRRLWESLSPTAHGCRCDLRLAGGREASGVTRGLDPSGGLRVRLDGAGVQVVTASEAIRVFHSRPRGASRAGGAGPP